MYSIIKPRGDIKSNWEKINPLLREREWGIEWEDTIGVGNVKVKIGDGIKNWNDLDYAIIGNMSESVIKSFATIPDAEENPELQENTSLDLLFAQIKKKFEYVISAQNKQPKQIVPITLTASGWTGTVAPYTQMVTVDGLTEGDNPLLVRMLEDGSTEAQQKAYNKAFGIISEGTGVTGDGVATFKVYKKPATDITVGLNGVIGGIYAGDNNDNISGALLLEEGTALDVISDKYCTDVERYFKYGNVVTIIMDISKAISSNSTSDDDYIFESCIHTIGCLNAKIRPASNNTFTCPAKTWNSGGLANRWVNVVIHEDGSIQIDNTHNNDVAEFIISFTYLCSDSEVTQDPDIPPIDCNSDEAECTIDSVECIDNDCNPDESECADSV